MYQSSVLLWIYPAGTVLLVAVRVSYRSACEAIRLAWLLEDIIGWRYVTLPHACCPLRRTMVVCGGWRTGFSNALYSIAPYGGKRDFKLFNLGAQIFIQN